MITSELRQAIARALAARGFTPAADPGLRPAGQPGRYAASVALTLGADPRAAAAALAETLAANDWIQAAEVTGPGYLTITVTAPALAAVAGQVTAAGPGCVASDALTGVTVPAAPPGDPLAAGSWEPARAALAARLTARLAAAAGATVAEWDESERGGPLLAPARASGRGGTGLRSDDSAAAAGAGARRPGTEVAAAVAFAGPDAVTFTLARAIPGKPVRIDPGAIARHGPGNPAYAVRYAHARAASGVRWAASLPGETTSSPEAGSGGWTHRARLLDALSWLPERVATAARRGRPDEFARYLEDLASVTVDELSSGRRLAFTAREPSQPPGPGRLALAEAARTGLAAGLGLLGVSAPDRL